MNDHKENSTEIGKEKYRALKAILHSLIGEAYTAAGTRNIKVNLINVYVNQMLIYLSDNRCVMQIPSEN